LKDLSVEEEHKTSANDSRARFDIHRTIEAVANTLSIVTCLTVIAVILSAYVPMHKVVAGFKKNAPAPLIPGIMYAASPQSLLLFLNSGCGYCQQSLPFYSRITKEAAVSRTTKVIAVFSSTEEKPELFLSNHGISVDQIVTADFRKLAISVTPTVMLVDHSGRILDFWIGMIPQSREGSVLRHVVAKE
jgi:hypothetical protein